MLDVKYGDIEAAFRKMEQRASCRARKEKEKESGRSRIKGLKVVRFVHELVLSRNGGMNLSLFNCVLSLLARQRAESN